MALLPPAVWLWLWASPDSARGMSEVWDQAQDSNKVRRGMGGLWVGSPDVWPGSEA